MAVSYSHLKRYQNFYGVDLKASVIEANDTFATDIRNVQMKRNGTLEKRRGFQRYAKDEGGFGLFAYQQNLADGELVEILTADSKLYRLKEATLTITYSGTAPAAVTVSYSVEDEEYKLVLIENSEETASHLLGIGTETSPVTLTSLAAAISAPFSATVTGDGSVPAAFLNLTLIQNLDPTLEITAGAWEEVNCPLAAPFAGSETHKNDSDFENISSVVTKNCLFLSNGYDEVYKYDGQTLYRAGVPTPDNFTITNAAVGPSGSWYYAAQYIQKDAVGNVIEGNLTFVQTSGTAYEPSAGDPATLTLKNILSTTGFNTNCAIINGAQSTTNTITVDSGHTLNVGDTAYFYDGVSTSYVEREITAKTATSITIAGAAVTVADNEVISNNLRIAVYRTQINGGLASVFFELAQVPNNSFTATQSFLDQSTDAQIANNARLLIPVTDRSPPQKGKYLSVFQNLLVTAGNVDEPNTVSFSDIESPEYFPIPDNQVTISNLIGDKITGIAPSNENFIIFQKYSVHAITGDVVNTNFRVDQLTNDIGCVAHASIQNIKGLLFFLSPVGPRVITGAEIPKALGPDKANPLVSRIDPVFEQRGVPDTEQWRVKRAVGLNDRLGEKYWLFVPTETNQSAGARSTNSNSRVFVFDYSRGAWLVWDTIAPTSGIVVTESDIYWQGREWDSSASVNRAYLHKQQVLDEPEAYQDISEPISAFYKSPWEFMGEAGVLKTFKAIRVYGVETINKEYELAISTESNWAEDVDLSSLSMTFGSGEGYGESAYGTEPYGDPAPTAKFHPLANGRVYSLRVIFANAEEQTNFNLSAYELEVAAPYATQFKS